MEPKWRILVVDDEEDVHMVTRLALKHKTWRDRGFELTSAHDSIVARKLVDDATSPFDAALVDVIMETDDAGIRLCGYLRQKSPQTRVILRTGQPGGTQEARIMKEHGISLFISKPDATQERLYDILCKAVSG